MGLLELFEVQQKTGVKPIKGNLLVGDSLYEHYIPVNFIGCDLNSQFELYIWNGFTRQFGFRSSEVVTWEKIDTDYYKAYLKNGNIIFYDVHDNFWRELNQEEAEFKGEENWCREFARRLVRIMNIRGINQYDLARITGCSQSSISNYISGKRVPSSYASHLIAKALDCSLNYLVHF